MPFTLPAFHRRNFILGSATTCLGLSSPKSCFSADNKINQNRFALLADTHIAEDPERVLRGAKMSEHLEKVCQQLIKLEVTPARAFIDGDCAVTAGESGDYATLLKLLQPVRDHGIPFHLALGNHDHRERMWEGIKFTKDDSVLEEKHVSLIKTPRVNWIVLDSLIRVNHTPGEIGEHQLKWLKETLDKHSNQPVMIMIHHNPTLSGNKNSLTDTKALYDVIVPAKQVKAVFFGHTHNWNINQYEGIHLVNLPPVAYVFSKGKPSGWVDCLVSDDSMQLTLHSLNKNHDEHMKTHQLKWRT